MVSLATREKVSKKSIPSKVHCETQRNTIEWNIIFFSFEYSIHINMIWIEYSNEIL